MKISLFVAITKNRVVGVKNQLPWKKLSSDMTRFQEMTNGHPVIMGSKTYESIPPKRRPLPGRTNIVLTRDPEKKFEGCLSATSLAEGLRLAAEQPGAEEVFVIGGGHVFAEAIPVANRIYLTEVDVEIKNGDAFFPELDPIRWKRETVGQFTADAKNEHGGTFYIYDRTNKFPIVEPNNARGQDYENYLKQILASGTCPFCPEGVTNKDQPTLYTNEHWWIRNTLQPLPNTVQHLLITPKRHVVRMEELTPEEWASFSQMLAWVQKELAPTGVAYYWRQGELMVTGASVSHVHVQAIVPAGLVNVLFGPFSK